MIWSSVFPTFLASLVEFVEALTIVMVVGATVNWRSSLSGAGAAVVILTGIVLALGSTFLLLPLEGFRLVVGLILVLFGLKWLKKALLRFAGWKALHDEEAIYEEEAAVLRARDEAPPRKLDAFAVATSFKSVLLEGLEVVFIVLTFGTSTAVTDGQKLTGILMASLGALLALAVVVLLGFVIRKPLTRIPENALKFLVGLMLTSFGTFWGAEGLGVAWPWGDLTLLALLGVYGAASLGMIGWLKSKKTVSL